MQAPNLPYRGSLLTDECIASLVLDKKSPLICPQPTANDFYGPDSPIQSASLDLHVGDIFTPLANSDSNEPEAQEELILKTGSTAYIKTKEKLHFPSDVAAISFAPSRVSERGLLVVNPGHIDAGYQGHIHLTVINMSKEDIILRNGKFILTVLLFSLHKTPKADWKHRQQQKASQSPPNSRIRSTLGRLSSDFLEIQTRAKDITTKALKEADYNIKKTNLIIALLSVIGTFLITATIATIGGVLTYNTKIQDLKTELALTRETFDRHLEIRKQVDELSKRIETLQSKPPNAGLNSVKMTAAPKTEGRADGR